MLDEKSNKALANIQKYQESLKRYYKKSVDPRQLKIGDLVLKKDICTKDKHMFSTPWEGPFIVVDIAAPGAYVLAVMAACSLTVEMPISCANIMLDISD
jgi:hypothetical protein